MAIGVYRHPFVPARFPNLARFSYIGAQTFTKMAELKFTVNRNHTAGHGMFTIPDLGTEHLETLWESLNLFCRAPVGKGENATSAAYRALASDMRHEVKRALDMHYNEHR